MSNIRRIFFIIASIFDSSANSGKDWNPSKNPNLLRSVPFQNIGAIFLCFAMA